MRRPSADAVRTTAARPLAVRRSIYHSARNIYNDNDLSATLNITEATGRSWKTQIRPGKTWTIGRAK